MAASEIVYLLHFDRPYHHARHYMGTTRDLVDRIARHRAGHGARLIEVVVAAGITVQCVRTWEGGRAVERRLKRRHAGTRLCPLCRAEARRRRAAGGE